MAKVSKINIAITGDSKGLAAATDAATRELRRLEAQSERTGKKLGAQRQSVQQTAEAMAKLGLQSRALGAVGGAIGLAQVATTGGALGAGAIAAGAGIGGALAAINISQQINDLTARARKAIDETALDARKSIEQSGFSSPLAQAIVQGGFGVKTAGQNLGAMDSLFAGIAATRAGNVGGQLLSAGLPALSTGAGVLLGGGGTSAAAQLGAAQLKSGDAAQDALMAYHMNMASSAPGGPIGYLLQLMAGD